VAVDQVRLGELKRLRSYFLGWGMSAKAAGVDEEIAKLYRAAKAPAPVDETPVVESVVIETNAVETATDSAATRRRPARKR
jgi:hypothetical protein